MFSDRTLRQRTYSGHPYFPKHSRTCRDIGIISSTIPFNLNSYFHPFCEESKSKDPSSDFAPPRQTSSATVTTSMAPTSSHLNQHDHTQQDQMRILDSSPYVEQLRRLGHDLLRENSRLSARIRALEKALEDEKATGMILQAARKAKRRH